MMLDEPFSNLDVSLRNQLRDLVLHVIKRTTASSVIVTHDPELAARCDRRLQLSEGLCVEA